MTLETLLTTIRTEWQLAIALAATHDEPKAAHQALWEIWDALESDLYARELAQMTE